MSKIRLFSSFFTVLLVLLVFPRSANSSEKPLGNRYFASALDQLPITVTTTNNKNQKISNSAINRCKSVVYKTLSALPKNHTAQLENLTLAFTTEGRRGLAGGNELIIRCTNITDSELSAVLVHEIGHLIDTGLFQGSYEYGTSAFDDFGAPIYNDDLSALFYSISWQDTDTRKTSETNLPSEVRKTKEGVSPLQDFVSGYAASDPFEDFAETYMFYRLQGTQFRSMAEENEALRLKYNFMKTYVFNDKEFTSDVLNKKKSYRPFDATVTQYDVYTFWAG